MIADYAPISLCIADELKNQSKIDSKFISMPFFKNGIPLLNPCAKWGMSLRSAKSMRFRWNETNQNRNSFLIDICSKASKNHLTTLNPVSLELIHSKEVFVLNNGLETKEKQGDGMITQNQNLLPVVTVADCMPIFLYDVKNHVFGVLHSGWKGTGIIENALEKAKNQFGTNIQDVCVVLGPHIHECCYIVDKERAEYFANNFTPECVSPVNAKDLEECIVPEWNNEGKQLFKLSLEKANLSVLKKIGVNPKNVVACTDCTCCTSPAIFGSFRRETSKKSTNPPNLDGSKYFTVQAAFCGYL